MMGTTTAQILHKLWFQIGTLMEQIRSRCTRRVVAVLLMASFFAILFAATWLFIDRRMQINRLERASERIQQLLNDSKEANWQTEILRGELSNSRAEVKTIRDELTRLRQNLKTIQLRNTEAVERLNEQVRRLTDSLYILTENPGTLSKSGTSGK